MKLRVKRRIVKIKNFGTWRGFISISISKEKLNAILYKETNIDKDWYEEINKIDNYEIPSELSIFGTTRFFVEDLEYQWQIIRCYIKDNYNISIKKLPFDIENGGIIYHAVSWSEREIIKPFKVETYLLYLDKMIKDGNKYLKYIEKECKRKPNELYKELKYAR